MPRGENPEFKERVGVLSDKLFMINIKRSIRSKLRKRSDMDKIDFESFVDRSLSVSENVSLLEDRYWYLLDNSRTELDIESELEKYEALRDDFRKRHEVE